MARLDHPETDKMRRFLRYRVGVPMYASAAASALLLEPLRGFREIAGVVATGFMGACMAVLVGVPELLEYTIRAERRDGGDQDGNADRHTPRRAKDDPWHLRLEQFLERYKRTTTAVGAILVPVLIVALPHILD
jgi:hypothetical protein